MAPGALRWSCIEMSEDMTTRASSPGCLDAEQAPLIIISNRPVNSWLTRGSRTRDPESFNLLLYPTELALLVVSVPFDRGTRRRDCFQAMACQPAMRSRTAAKKRRQRPPDGVPLARHTEYFRGLKS